MESRLSINPRDCYTRQRVHENEERTGDELSRTRGLLNTDRVIGDCGRVSDGTVCVYVCKGWAKDDDGLGINMVR